MTKEEAATYLRIKLSTINGWMKQGVIPYFKVGGEGNKTSVRIMKEDLDGVIAAWRKNTTNRTVEKPLK